jgi:multiple sugar transport system ATP-binding protein
LPTGSEIRVGEKARFAVDLSKAVLFDAETGVAI